MRRALDALYEISGWAAAFSIFAIFALVALQVIARLFDGALRLMGQPVLGLIVPSIAEICGFLLAAASFLALAKTLTVSGHIRVGMLVDRLPPRPRRLAESIIGLLASILSIYSTVALARLTLKSFAYNDVSYGIVPVPLALPQGLMTLGLAILSIALLDLTIRVWRGHIMLQSGPES